MDKRIRTLTLSMLERRRRSYVHFSLDREPKSKKASRHEQKELQKVFLGEMKRLGRTSFTKDIAIEIEAQSTGKTPPQVQKFVKNILDVMYKKEYLDNYDDAGYLPFIDDRQIKYLRAQYSFFSENPRIVIRLRNFNSFINDVLLARDLIGNSDTSIDISSEYRSLNELMANKDRLISSFSEEAYKSMIMMKRADLQKGISNELGLTPFMISLIYPKRIKGSGLARIINTTYHDWAIQSLKMPIRIQLPEIPTINDSKKEYKQYIKNQLEQYMESHPIFNGLLFPLIISAYYKPPNTRIKNFFKDIDNIMLDYLAPAFNKVFSPPITLYGLTSDNAKDERLRQDLKKYPKSLHGSAIGYEIIELPKRFPEPTGFLTVGFHLTEFGRSLMDTTDETIYTYMSELSNSSI